MATMLVLGLVVAQAAILAEPLTLKSLSDSVNAQDRKWEDLTIDYRCDIAPTDLKVPRSKYQLRWVVTRDGMERVTRKSQQQDGTGHLEEAAYDGRHYMTFDSQRVGSGSVGQQIAQFLSQSLSPKRFGLYVTGQEVGKPITLGQWLTMPESHCKIESQSDDEVTVFGADPMAKGMSLKLVLAKKFNYRPIRLELSDDKGLLTVIDNLNYRAVTANGSTIWFPSRGEWHGFDPATRKVVSVVHYTLTNVEVDRHPNPDEFVLQYPAGCLLLNTDTSETYYTTAATTTSDPPAFTRKLMSMAEHDRLPDTAIVPTSEWSSLRLVSIVLTTAVMICLAMLLARRRYARVEHSA